MYIHHTLQQDFANQLASHFDKGYLPSLSQYLGSNTLLVFSLYHPTSNDTVEISLEKTRDMSRDWWSLTRYALMVDDEIIKTYALLPKYGYSRTPGNYVLIEDVEKYKQIKNARVDLRIATAISKRKELPVPKGFAKRIRHHRGFAQVTDKNLRIVRTSDGLYKVIRLDRDSRPSLVYFQGKAEVE